jgi:hypothetical protein
MAEYAEEVLMKVVAIVLLLSLALSSCSLYKGMKIIEQEPADYEYRCLTNMWWGG